MFRPEKSGQNISLNIHTVTGKRMSDSRKFLGILKTFKIIPVFQSSPVDSLTSSQLNCCLFEATKPPPSSRASDRNFV